MTGKLKSGVIRSALFLLLAQAAAVAAPAATSPLSKMGVGSNGSTLSVPMQIAISLTLLRCCRRRSCPSRRFCASPSCCISCARRWARKRRLPTRC